MKPYPLSSLNHFTTPVAIEPSSDDLRAAYAEEGGPRSATPALLTPGRPGPLRGQNTTRMPCRHAVVGERIAGRRRAGPRRHRSELATAEQPADAPAEDGRDEVALKRLRAVDELDARDPVAARVGQLEREIADAV